MINYTAGGVKLVHAYLSIVELIRLVEEVVGSFAQHQASRLLVSIHKSRSLISKNIFVPRRMIGN